MLRLFLANKHTSAAAIIYVVAKLGAQLGAVWVPAHSEQFKATADLIESAAIAYGLLAAGDAAQSQPRLVDNSTTTGTTK